MGGLPMAVLLGHRSLWRRQRVLRFALKDRRGRGVIHGGGGKGGGRQRRRGWPLLGQKEQGILGRSCLSGLDLRLWLVLDL